MRPDAECQNGHGLELTYGCGKGTIQLLGAWPVGLSAKRGVARLVKSEVLFLSLLDGPTFHVQPARSSSQVRKRREHSIQLAHQSRGSPFYPVPYNTPRASLATLGPGYG